MLTIRHENQERKLPLRILDLFAGAGGLSLGFDRYNTTVGQKIYQFIGAVEMDKDACNTLRLNHPDLVGDENTTRIIEGDITKDDVHKKVIERIGKIGVDIIVGGPPCQSFSMIGTRSGRWVDEDGRCKEDHRDLLFEEYVRLVEQLQPLIIVLENVDGIRSKRDELGRPYLSRIIGDLEGKGYHFTINDQTEQYLRLNAADHGVPQVRHRIFLVGTRISGFSMRSPASTHGDPEAHPDGQLPAGRQRWITLRDAIGDLPKVLAHYTGSNVSLERWQELQEENTRRKNGADECPYHDEEFQQHYQRLDQSGKAFLDFVAGSHGVLLRYHKARCQQESDIQLFEKMPAGATAKDIFEGEEGLRALKELIRYDMESFKDKYRKQQWSHPGTTIFAHLERDGNRFIHPDKDQARTFTVREAARIQSFPDDYLFAGAMKSRYRQIGNAVPPLLARAIAGAIHTSLRENSLLYENGTLVPPEDHST